MLGIPVDDRASLNMRSCVRAYKLPSRARQELRPLNRPAVRRATLVYAAVEPLRGTDIAIRKGKPPPAGMVMSRFGLDLLLSSSMLSMCLTRGEPGVFFPLFGSGPLPLSSYDSQPYPILEGLVPVTEHAYEEGGPTSFRGKNQGDSESY